MGEHANGFWHGLAVRRFGLSNERGQSLIIVVLAMFVVIGIMAVAVDLATWYQKHHQAQVAADAAALSAANCMANAGITLSSTPTTVLNACTTGSDTADATSVATSIAAKNGVTIPSGNVTINTTSTTSTTGCPATSACVTATNSSPPLFAGIFGVGSTSQTAKASADYTAPITSNCTSSASGACYFAFAKDSNCADTGITLSNNGNVTVTGGIWSNSGLDMSGTDNNSHWGNVTYGQGCTYTPSGNNPKFTSGPSPHAPLASWPRDYTTVITACGGTGNPCNSGGTPSFCTQSAAKFGTSTSSTYAFATGQVYCAYGTGTKSDPSTWNGNIYISAKTGTYSDTFIGGYVNIASQGSVTISSQLSTSIGNLLVYANDFNSASPTTTSAADVSTQGSATLSGDMFVPNGTLDLSTQGTGTVTTFLEANQMSISAGGGITGDGPSTGTDGQTLAGSDQLTQ